MHAVMPAAVEQALAKAHAGMEESNAAAVTHTHTHAIGLAGPTIQHSTQSCCPGALQHTTANHVVVTPPCAHSGGQLPVIHTCANSRAGPTQGLANAPFETCWMHAPTSPQTHGSGSQHTLHMCVCLVGCELVQHISVDRHAHHTLEVC